ncbi:glycoside hydrolase family 64 protein [Kordia algicida OT-1]|uniref:Putative sugar hydrolase n=1 Tax=Kordia algicida OT-1 TaxID=391587 RepID=A9EAH1_9FLAO|nr:glycoside hydrolase family 64 protein [Kordia algicida]EDP94629.1 putative sugar hydrolase [Kordia algicida OT-1]
MSIQVNITNNSGTSSSDVYWICFGLDSDPATSSPNWSYVDVDSNGNASLQKFTKGQDCSKLFKTVDELSAFNNLPPMWSGQFLFSFNQLPNVFNIVSGGQNGLGVQTPPFTPGTADADTLFVVVEFTNIGTELYADCTIVDYFSAPVSIEVIGKTDSKTNGIMKSTSSRDAIFDGITALGSPWSNLIMKDGSGNNIRVLGPQHAVQTTNPNLLSSTIYDAYVDACWKNFKSNTLTINCPTFGTYTGTVNSSDELVFSQTDQPDVTIQKPGPGKAYDIFGCVGTLAAPNNTPLGEIAAILGAALNRTILSSNGNDTQPNCTTSDFYTVQNGVTNEYANIVHQNYKSGIYAFPFDDVCSKDSPLIDITNPTNFNITLSDWS